MRRLVSYLLAAFVALALGITPLAALAADDELKVDCANAMSTVEMNLCGEKNSTPPTPR